MSVTAGPTHALELLAQPLDIAFHPKKKDIIVTGNIEGDLTVFDFDNNDAGKQDARTTPQPPFGCPYQMRPACVRGGIPAVFRCL